MTRPEVVVTGLGATTPLGGDVASTWDAMLAGKSGVTPLTQEWAAGLPVRIAAVNQDAPLPDVAMKVAGQARGDGKQENAARERIWFSPHCLP